MAYDKTKDPLYATAATAISPGRRMAAVTPSDSEDLAAYAKSLRIETAGTLKFIPVENDDEDVVTLEVTAGEVLDFVQVRRVMATGTTAEDIWAIWN
jgi:hypothetical protein